MKRQYLFFVILGLVACSKAGPNGGIPSLAVGSRTPMSVAGLSFPSMTHLQTPLPTFTGAPMAAGPYEVASIALLPNAPMSVTNPVDDETAQIDLTAPLQFVPNLIESTLSAYNYNTGSALPSSPSSAASTLSAQARRRRATIVPNSSFTSYSDTDLGAATNGSYIVMTESEYSLEIFSMNGTLIKNISLSNIYCGTSALPVCALGYNVGAGDNRVIYDPGAQRWVLSALWVNSGGPLAVPYAVLAVSETSDPTGSWYIYQFPNCGPTDKTIGDQPRLGFNNQWIVVTSSCSLSADASLNVFDKSNLFAGGAITQNSTWFAFADPSNVSNKDNPARTYVATPNNREYLTFLRADTNTNKEQIVYSHVEGPVDAPVLYPQTDAVDTTVPWINNGIPLAVNGPGCTACVAGATNGTIQSSDVFQLSDGNAYILSTNVSPDATYSNANDVLANAISSTGISHTLALLPSSPGQGAFASEIGLPLQQSQPDTAIIAYNFSSSSFYPGAYAAQWNITYNRLDYNDVLMQGNIVPPGGALRITDFIDAFAPIPGSSQSILGTHVEVSGATNYREAYWVNLSTQDIFPCDFVGGTCNFSVSWPLAGTASCTSLQDGGGITDAFTGAGEQFVASPTTSGTLTQNIPAGTAQYTRTAAGTVTIAAQEQYESYTYSRTGICVGPHFTEATFAQWAV